MDETESHRSKCESKIFSAAAMKFLNLVVQMILPSSPVVQYSVVGRVIYQEKLPGQKINKRCHKNVKIYTIHRIHNTPTPTTTASPTHTQAHNSSHFISLNLANSYESAHIRIDYKF